MIDRERDRRGPWPAWLRFIRAVGVSLLLLTLLWTHAPVPPEPTALAAPAPAIAGLRVSGNQILNGAGQPIRLRGVNRTSGEYACIQNWGIFEGPTDDTAIQAMLSWKINAVRIPLNEDCWLDVNTTGIDRQYVGTSYRNAVTDYVNRLTAAGIVVILDLHWAAPGTQKANQQLPMANRDHSPAFWSSVAGTFKTNSAVIFDLFNEPYPDGNTDTTAAWRCVRDGSNGAGTCPQVGYTAAGMQELLNAVRATGATNVVMLAGVAYTGVLSRWMEFLPTDSMSPPNLAASVHIYPPGSQCSNVSCWDQYLAPIAAQYPIVAGETGQNSCAHDRLDTVLDWMEAKQQHYLVWVWWTEPCGSSAYYGLITDYLTGAPSQGYGQGYKARLAALVGAPTATPTQTSVPTQTPTQTPTRTPTLTQTSGPAQTSTPTRTPTATSTSSPTSENGFTTSASAAPSTVAPGGTTSVTANVTSATAGTYVVNLEIHDAAENAVYQWYWENVPFSAGQTRSFTFTWPVPANQARGSYTVQVGIFSQNWGQMYTWNSYAAYVTVGSTPTSTFTPTPTATPTRTSTPTATPTSTQTIGCSPRPPVAVTTRGLGGGRLEVTVRAGTLPTTPTNGLDLLTFGQIRNATVNVNGATFGSGGQVSLGGVQTTTFVVTRQTAWQTTTVPFTVRDRCGDWRTFVGGGPFSF
ncbi:MAG: cellulase family glycosylhydrolase [Chloroflexota bacterium]